MAKQTVLPGVLKLETVTPFQRRTISIKCLLGPDPIAVTDGYAKWEVIDRRKRRGITEWTGTNPLVVELAFVIDYFSSTEDNPGLACEEDIRDLETMAGLIEGGDVKPPEIVWEANGPHDNAEASHLTWVIKDLKWGDAMYTDAGNRIRQAGTLQLLQFVPDEFLTLGGAAKNQKKTGKKLRRNTRYKVKKSDKDLKSIAQHELGNANLWTEIAKLNKLRGPKRTKKWPAYLLLPPK
jgi:hypothetical protein